MCRHKADARATTSDYADIVLDREQLRSLEVVCACHGVDCEIWVREVLIELVDTSEESARKTLYTLRLRRGGNVCGMTYQRCVRDGCQSSPVVRVFPRKARTKHPHCGLAARLHIENLSRNASLGLLTSVVQALHTKGAALSGIVYYCAFHFFYTFVSHLHLSRRLPSIPVFTGRPSRAFRLFQS